MSALAQMWVASIKVGNQTAKQLLQFLASHNFAKPGFEFSNKTLADQLEVKERAIQRAFKLLIDKKLIIKEPRYDKKGRQLSNQTWLNIPQEFVDKCFGEDVFKTSLGVSVGRGEGARRTPLNNNINNKNNNKKQRKPKKSVDKKLQSAPMPQQNVSRFQAKTSYSYSQNTQRCTLKFFDDPLHPDYERTYGLHNFLNDANKFNREVNVNVENLSFEEYNSFTKRLD